MHSLAQRVLFRIRRQELLRAGERVGVAVSGGIDSVALLRLLLELRHELGIVVSVVHFNHKLRGAESDADEAFVGDLARAHDLEFYVDSDDVAGHAAEEHVSVEAAARELRYGFFRSLIEGSPAGAEAPAHRAAEDRRAESAAPPKGGPQGLKPDSSDSHLRGAEAPLFHEGLHGAALSRALSKLDQMKLDQIKLDKIATGHTLDDQAETVLMRIIRGAGLRGLGGIYPRITVEDDDGEVCGEIVRPLLAIRRRELEQYLHDIGQTWREDATNADDKFTRNRVRKLVVPLLEKEFNPAVAENLAELADIARGEEDYWENEVAGWMGTAVHWSEPEWARALSKSAGLVQITTPVKIPISAAKSAAEMGHPEGGDLQARIDNSPCLVMNASVDRMWFLSEPVAVQRRLVKAIGDHGGIPLEFKHVEEILHLAAAESGSSRELSLPLGWKLVRRPEELVFVTPDLRDPEALQDYEYELAVPGDVQVTEIGSSIEARCIPGGSEAGYNPEHLLNADSLPGPLRVRNWRSGDRFWPAHTKAPKKIKELLQERQVPQPERKLWPVITCGNEIVWMRGFPAPAKFQSKPGRQAVLISDIPLAGKRST